jgi:hypothetical protein
MPLFTLLCTKCGFTKKLLTTKKWGEVLTSNGQKDLLCPGCEKYLMTRCGKGPTTNTKEKLDNGAMVRAVERYSNAEELFKERNKTADPNAGRSNVS